MRWVSAKWPNERELQGEKEEKKDKKKWIDDDDVPTMLIVLMIEGRKKCWRMYGDYRLKQLVNKKRW